MTAEPISDIEEALPELLASYSEHGDVPVPDLSGKELGKLAEGIPVVKVSLGERTVVDDSVTRMGVVGIRVVNAPRLLVWLTAMGVASEPDVRLIRATLSRDPDGSYTRYQHVNLPWPVRDRHWAIYCEKNVEVASSSGGRYWEHRWSLIGNGEDLLRQAFEDGRISGLTERQMNKSIYLPSNRGAWVLSELSPDKTLVVAFFDGSLGGLFPNSVVRQFTKLHLREGLNLVSELSMHAYLEYNEQPLIHDGYGRPITRQDVLNAARQLQNAPGLAANR